MPDGVVKVIRHGMPQGNEMVEIVTAANITINVYVSATGRSVRVYKRRPGKRSTILREAQ